VCESGWGCGCLAGGPGVGWGGVGGVGGRSVDYVWGNAVRGTWLVGGEGPLWGAWAWDFQTNCAESENGNTGSVGGRKGHAIG